jgi:hypothetical protein
MKNLYLKRLAIVGICTALAVLFTVNNASAQDDESGNPKISSRPVHVFMTPNVVPSAGTILFRSRGGVSFTFNTHGLPAGNVVTAWMAVFNNPEFCASNPCTPADFANPAVEGAVYNTGGRVIGPDGAASYGAYRAVGDTTGYWAGLNVGILDPLRAEIHLVLRSHGPALLMDPAALQQQLTMFNGGCPPNSCANVQDSVHQR